jgi:hypothetical protein
MNTPAVTCRDTTFGPGGETATMMAAPGCDRLGHASVSREVCASQGEFTDKPGVGV